MRSSVLWFSIRAQLCAKQAKEQNTSMTKMSKERLRKRRRRALAKLVRILTVAPIIALIAFTIMLSLGGVFNSISEYLHTLIFITALPLCAYPLQKIIPPFKHKGRKGQRTLAMIMSIIGYLLGVVYSLSADTSPVLRTVFITYALSGVALFIINKLLHFKASGHACGVAGPVGVIIYFMGWSLAGALTLFCGIAILAASLWATLKTHAHSAMQFIVGAIIPIIFFYTLTLF